MTAATQIRPDGAIVTNAQKTAALFRPMDGHNVDAIREAIEHMSTCVPLHFPFVCRTAAATMKHSWRG
jgi:hypothetical protein